jgi:hypothetical protein
VPSGVPISSAVRDGAEVASQGLPHPDHTAVVLMVCVCQGGLSPGSTAFREDFSFGSSAAKRTDVNLRMWCGKPHFPRNSGSQCLC